MSLTSYRAAPPRARVIYEPVLEVFVLLNVRYFDFCALCRPGSDLLSRVLRQSTIGAGAFHGRVRNGIGCSRSAITTRSAKGTETNKKLEFFVHSVFQHTLCADQMDIDNENNQVDRAISTGQLHALPHFHIRPINVVVFHGSDREYSF